MSNKRTLKQIKDDYAVKQGFANWYELITYCNEKYLDHYITEVMKIYAMECLELASERACIEPLGMMTRVDKKSITNENNIIK